MKEEITCPRCEKKWWTCKHVICFVQIVVLI